MPGAAGRNPADAANHYRDALELATELGMRPLAAHSHLGLAKLYPRTGKAEQAGEHVATAAAMYREMGMVYWLGLAQVVSETRRSIIP